MNKGYAFIDKGGVLHVVESTQDAERNSTNGKVIETDIESKHGYPTVNGKQIVIYSVNECYEDANRDGGVKLDTERVYPALAELYKDLLG